MGTVSKVWIATGVVAVGAAATALFIARGGGTSSVAPTTPLSVKAALDRNAVEFGDPVSASVTVLADSRNVRASDIEVRQDLAPLTQLGRTQITRTERGRLLVLTYRTEATCLDQRCIANGRPKRVALAPVRVDVGGPGGGTERASWPALQIRSRVLPGDVDQEDPPLRSDPTPPPVSYRISPDTLALVVTLVAVLLAVAGVLLGGWAVAGIVRRRRSGTRRLAGLERALALAREAEGRPPADRRARSGCSRGCSGAQRALADEAEELAWSAPAPQPASLADLVTQVEREVNGA